MLPGMDPRQMRQMMKRMGIQEQQIDAVEVIIRTPEHNIIISNPSVSKINMGGQATFQIMGQESVQSLDTKAEINEDDIKTVMNKTGVDEEKAREAIEEADGDLAQAILNLSE